MRRTIRTATRLLPVALLGAMLTSCDDTGTTPPPPPDTTATPATYTFDSRFTTGGSSVAYNGQVVRSLLIQDLKTIIDNLGKPGAQSIAMSDLLKYYDHNDADNLSTLTTTGTLPALETKYAALGKGVKLTNKISPAQVIGTGRSADQLIREWLQIIADNSQNPARLGTPNVYIDDQGRNLSQMINKLLHGSVAYYQGTGVYLQGLLEKDNTKAVEKTDGGTEPFTAMEHSWDEAFGYWGAARDYARYTDAQLAGSAADYVFDSNGDGRIDLKSEYNYTFARNAGKRDKGATGIDLTKETFDAFLKGRTTIVNKGTVDGVSAYRTIVANNWEKNIAATVIHYINEVRTYTAALTNGSTPANSAALSGAWGEMKGFAMGLQYNPFKMIGDAQITQLHELLGDAPVIAAAGTAENAAYIVKLESARSLLKNIYGFSDATVTNW